MSKSLEKMVNDYFGINPFADLFDFDRHFYCFNRDEKDQHPYDVVRTNDSLIITHNILGIKKEDLKVKVQSENKRHYIVIVGSSKDEVTNKNYMISSRFCYDPEEIDVSKATSKMENGLLYITIPYKVKKVEEGSTFQIDIQ